MVVLTPPSSAGIDRAVAALRAGAVIGLPTETVYGLAGDATNAEAVARIFALKQRPSFNPLIVHGADIAMLEGVAAFDDRARLLADSFWPGPLTLVLARRPGGVVDLVTAGLDTVAVRVPDHPIAAAVIAGLGRPLAAPSANPSGRLSPTAPLDVAQAFGEAVPVVLAGGRARVGLESTILDLSGNTPVLLRPGGVPVEEIEPLIGPITVDQGSDSAPRSPGRLLRHYAPETPLRLNAMDVAPDEALLSFGPDLMLGRKAMAVRALSDAGDLTQAAAALFSLLRELDRIGARAIAVMPIPETGLGAAINDRLRRAAEAQGDRP